MTVAAVDCGTNSIRLLVAEAIEGEGVAEGEESAPPAMREVLRQMEIVRLGEGVDQTGRLGEEALERTLGVARTYADLCRQHGVGRGSVRFVATSASRDAENAADFVDGVRDAFGDLDVTPEVVTGEEEAQLSFRGATAGLAAAGYEGPFLVVDIGGGSTEFARGTHEVVGAISLDVGCVRLTERHLRSDPPTQAEVDAAREDIARALDEAESVVGFGGVGTLVGLAGSVTTVTAHALGLTSYERAAIHRAEMAPSDVMTAAGELLAATREERTALGFMHPGRVDVIGAGALVWHDVVARVLAATGPELRVTASEADILDGIALSLI